MSDEHASLLAAIGATLGQPYVELRAEVEEAISLGTMFAAPVGYHRKVLGGAKDGASGRVAWIELRSAPPINGYVPVEIDVRFAWEGALRHVVEPYTYNPYFGCRVELARWYGERFVLLYREKHEMLLSHFDPPYERQDYVEVADDYLVDGDRVFYLSEHEPLLRGRVLPSMIETTPVPVPRAEHGQLLWLERPGVARLAALPRYESAETYDAAVARARDAALAIELP